MSWIKLSEELYLSDQSPYSLEKIDGIWYVVDNSTQKKSIPFTDIFNNPVFPVDYSNTDMIVKSLTSSGAVEGKHIRGESANTPGTPAFSFQGDIDTGLYRKSANVMGISSGGVEVSEINSLGVLNGTPGTDKRNVIKSTFQILNTGSNLNCASTSYVSTGYGFSYTPLSASSILRIKFFLSIHHGYGSMNQASSNSLLKIYEHTSIPSIGSAVQGTAKTGDLYTGEAQGFPVSGYFFSTTAHQIALVEVSAINTNLRNYYLAFKSTNASASHALYTATGNHSGYLIEELL